MLYFIYPADDTTKFLLEIPKIITKRFGKECLNIIIISPTEDSYSSCLQEITKIPEKSIIIFMGHGQDDKLWGAESEDFEKKPLILKNQTKIFANKHLLCLSCNSNEFLKGTFSYSKIISSIGFGSLPTSITEVENSKRLKEMGVNEEVISKYTKILIDLISVSLCNMLEKDQSFAELSLSILLRLNKKISEVVLEDKKSSNNRILSDLLFYMKTEMVFI